MLKRPKRGFNEPAASWPAAKLRQNFYDLTGPFGWGIAFLPAVVIRPWEEHEKKKRDPRLKRMALINFQLECRDDQIKLAGSVKRRSAGSGLPRVGTGPLQWLTLFNRAIPAVQRRSGSPHDPLF